MFVEIQTISELEQELKKSVGEIESPEMCLEKITLIDTDGKPGDKVIIHWKINESDLPHHSFVYDPDNGHDENSHDAHGTTLEFSDVGYIFTLPGYDPCDIWLGGVVHIPHPDCSIDDDTFPIWETLLNLSLNESVKQILICKSIDLLPCDVKRKYLL